MSETIHLFCFQSYVVDGEKYKERKEKDKTMDYIDMPPSTEEKVNFTRRKGGSCQSAGQDGWPAFVR